MNIIEPNVTLESATSYYQLLKLIEKAGRVCYKSEDKITEDSTESAEKFISGIIRRGHEAVLEHGSITLKFVCDRGVTHELVRHRLAAYCQESTRYCNYANEKFGKEITVIRPSLFAGHCDHTEEAYYTWVNAMQKAEEAYFEMLKNGCTPQEARSVLPNSLKTEIFVTMDIREWRHFLKLRAQKAAHPDMREVAWMAGKLLKEEFPIFFADVEMT